MMKKIIILFSFIIIFIFNVNSVDKIEKKINSMNIKNYILKDNYSKMIKKLYLFNNENNNTGGIALITLDEYKIDIYLLVLKDKDYYIIKTVDVMDENSLKDKKQMKELIDSISKMNEKRIENVSDTITGATQYSKKIYLKIKIVASNIVKELEK